MDKKTKQNIQFHEPIQYIVLTDNNKKDLPNSTSGGAFMVIAREIIKQNGIVFGCVLEDDGSCYQTFTRTYEGLRKFQGSKYVQSYINQAFSKCYKFLADNYLVLYSGTPCQVAGLYTYLNNKKLDQNLLNNLLTIDLFCEGYPDQQFFKDYLKWQANKLNADKIFNYTFRSKIESWDYTKLLSHFKYSYKNKIKDKYIYFNNDPYLHSFTKFTHHLNKCYTCKYSKQVRISDISIGDCWGIQNTHYDFYNKHKHEGISAVFLNSNKSLKFFYKYCSNKCTYITSTYDEIKQGVVDGNVNTPSLNNTKDIKEKETIDKMLKQGKNLEVFDYLLKKINAEHRRYLWSRFCYNVYKPISFFIPNFITEMVKKKLS